MKITSSKLTCVLLSLLLAASAFTMTSCEDPDATYESEISSEAQPEKQEKPKTEKSSHQPVANRGGGKNRPNSGPQRAKNRIFDNILDEPESLKIILRV